MLLFNDVVVYGSKEDIREDPPIIVVEIFDQDKVVSNSFNILFSYFNSLLASILIHGLFSFYLHTQVTFFTLINLLYFAKLCGSK